MGHLCRTAIRGGSGGASTRRWLSSELLLWPLLEGFFAIGLTKANGADKMGDMMGESLIAATAIVAVGGAEICGGFMFAVTKSSEEELSELSSRCGTGL